VDRCRATEIEREQRAAIDQKEPLPGRESKGDASKGGACTPEKAADVAATPASPAVTAAERGKLPGDLENSSRVCSGAAFCCCLLAKGRQTI
jgi:hypothetical protein